VRMYLAFMGPYGVTINYPWDPNGVVGVRRFLERVWRLFEKVDPEKKVCRTDSLVHKTIKGVGEDIEMFKFNTAIAKMMILVNAFEKEETLVRSSYKYLIQLLAPFAPHISEELWYLLGENESIHRASWPVFDGEQVKDETITIGVQVNGKVRAELVVAVDTAQETLQHAALELPRIKEYTQGKTVQKVIVVPNKIVNIVVL
jgi:leucyl-tRNA synthetase